MKVVVYSAHKFEMPYLEKAFSGKHNVKYITGSLSDETVSIAQGSDAVSIFVSDDASAKTLQTLSKAGVKFLVLRSAGYNHVDLAKAKRLNIKAARVPEYSPYSVAEQKNGVFYTFMVFCGLHRPNFELYYRRTSSFG